jgi:Bacterial capsule synthesis protein PGA_cap
MRDKCEWEKLSSRAPFMRARFLQRTNRSEVPCAYSAPNQSYENKRSLEPTRKLCPFTPKAGVNGGPNALARLTALGMTIQWGFIFLVLGAVQPCAAMTQSPQNPPPAMAQPSPSPALTAPAPQSLPGLQSVPPQTTPTPQPSPTLMPTSADNAAHPPSPNDEIVITAVGDVMLGTTFPDESTLPPNDGVDLLTEVTPFLKHGDVVYGNLEGPIVDGGDSAKCRGKKIGTCFAFRVPTRYGKYLKDAGFTAMGLANNHAMDFGDVARLTVKGRKMVIIAFATYPGAYNFLDLDESLQTIRTVKAESDLVIVGFHGGAEGATHQHVLEGDETFLGEDRGDLRRFTHAAIDAGADLVLGSGPHVVRAMEIYQGKLIAYSLGNFATYGPFNLNAENGLTMVLEAHLASDGTFLRGKAYAVKQEKPGGPKLDPDMKILPVLRALSNADFPQTAIAVGPQGELWMPGTQITPCVDAPDLLEQRFGAAACGIFP